MLNIFVVFGDNRHVDGGDNEVHALGVSYLLVVVCIGPKYIHKNLLSPAVFLLKHLVIRKRPVDIALYAALIGALDLPELLIQ